MDLHLVNTRVKHEGYKDCQIQTVCFALREKPLFSFTFYYFNLFFIHLIIIITDIYILISLICSSINHLEYIIFS